MFLRTLRTTDDLSFIIPCFFPSSSLCFPKQEFNAPKQPLTLRQKETRDPSGSRQAFLTPVSCGDTESAGFPHSRQVYPQLHLIVPSIDKHAVLEAGVGTFPAAGQLCQAGMTWTAPKLASAGVQEVVGTQDQNPTVCNPLTRKRPLPSKKLEVQSPERVGLSWMLHARAAGWEGVLAAWALWQGLITSQNPCEPICGCPDGWPLHDLNVGKKLFCST